MKQKTTAEAGLWMITRSSVEDFPTALKWAQWCRSVAVAAIIDDIEGLKNLKIEQILNKS